MVYLAPLKSTVIEAKKRQARDAAARSNAADAAPQSAYLQSVNTVLAHYSRLARGAEDNYTSGTSLPSTIPTIVGSSSATGSRTKMTKRAGSPVDDSDVDGRHAIHYNNPSSQFAQNANIVNQRMSPPRSQSPGPVGRPNSRQGGGTTGQHPRRSGSGGGGGGRVSSSPTRSRQTILDMIKDQVEQEGVTTMELLTEVMAEIRGDENTTAAEDGVKKKGGGVLDDPMVGCLVENTINESMRSVAEQCKTVGLEVSSVALSDQFTTFASSNTLLDALLKEKQGRSADIPTSTPGAQDNSNDPNEPNIEMWRSQLNKGFTYKGFDISERHPAAIIFPALERELGATAITNRSRLDVHVRCMLLGTVVLPQNSPHLKKSHPSNPTFSTISTITPEAEFKQKQRRLMRERLQREVEAEAMARVLGKDGEEAPQVAKPLSRRTEDDFLQELVLTSRRSRPLTQNCIDVIKKKIATHSVPLRPIKEISHLQLPGFVSYSDCGFIPERLVVYEVPSPDPHQPIRSTIDPSGLYTTRTSFYDDRFSFSSVEYTSRWCVPICAVRHQLKKDCWIRKQFIMPPQEAPVPLGALLQRCGRGCVSMDISERSTADSIRRKTQVAQRPSSANLRSFASATVEDPIDPHAAGNVLYRHSFMFADRVTATLMKDRRYGRSRRRASAQPQQPPPRSK